jgi:hypothetical protein
MKSVLKEDLIGLKSKLENLEKEFETKLKDVEEKESKFKKLDDHINEIVNTKDTVLKLNVGGKVFSTKISTLLSVKDTLFYKLISTSVENSNEVCKEIFFDRSYRHFPFILDYLRTKKFSVKGYTVYDIEDIAEEAEYYGLSEILNVVNDLQKEVEFIKMEAAPQYSTAGTNRLEDLKDRSLMTGVCVQSPYHIIIELNFEHYLEDMEIGGWNGNTSMWYPGNGSGTKIYTSSDKNTWKEVGTIPTTYGATIIKIKLIPSTGKFVKFQHNSYLGIGFLNFIRSTG